MRRAWPVVGLFALVMGACSSPAYTVGGTVTGLTGTGLVLQLDGANNLTIDKSGAFTFATPLSAKALYNVTVQTQPSSPAQTCSVAGGTGSIVAANVTSVAVTCNTAGFSVGGTVSGLAGTGLVLQDNMGDNLTVSSNGAFSFATPVPAGGTYAVTVETQPTSPTQTCAVANGSGSVDASNITNVAVTCTTSTFTIGGTITGLSGSGLVLQDSGGDNLTVSSGATSFAFATAIASGATYNVTVLTQPGSPQQGCMVSGGTGTVGSANITSITVNCSTGQFTVGGIVTGLVGSGLVLQDNDTDNLVVSGNGTFAFATTLASGTAYSITIATQPTAPSQSCTITGGAGTVTTTAVTSVLVTCSTNVYALSGTVTGLLGAGLVLQDNGGDNVPVAAGTTSFAFPTSLASGATYAISVLTQPTGPSQTCVVSNDKSGMIAGSAITDIAVTCSTSTFAIGGTVVGLTGTGLVLTDNSSDSVTITGNGPFSFPTAVASGATYDVTVATQPSNPAQTCVVSGATGTVVGASVGTVTVNCATNQYTVSGSVLGLSGVGLTLSLSGGPELGIGSNGTFAFPQTLTTGNAYAITVTSQPISPSQTCTVTNDASGTIASSDISDVAVSCTNNTYPITVTVSGVTGSGLTLEDNGVDSLSIPTSGTYTFAILVPSGSPYAVTVAQPPSGPSQTCTVANGLGDVGDGAVSNVTVACTTNTYTVSGTITGLAGTVVLQDNASDTLVVTPSAGGESLDGGAAGTLFTFAAAVASGSPYAITIEQQPASPDQTCTVTNDPSGIIGGAAITDVAITCTTNSFDLSATVIGLAGSGLVLQDDDGDMVPVTGNGPVTFPTAYASGDAYTVTVATQPTGPAQTCTVLGGTGTVGTTGVTGITVNCATNAYTIGGTVTGLSGTGLVLADNVGDSLSISGNGTFSFPSSYASGAVYSVTVAAQPSGPAQTCTATAGTASGTIGSANVTSIAFTCAASHYTVSVNVSGLQGTGLVLADNTTDMLSVTQNGVSTFALPVAATKPYAVTVVTQPTSLSQTCVVSSGSGTVVASNITVNVACTTNTYPVNVTVTGLAGTGLKFWNNGGNGLTVSANGTFAFTTQIPSGGIYDVTVLTQPTGPTQVCAATGSSPVSGTITNGSITIAFACTTSAFTYGGTVTGLVGTGLILTSNQAVAPLSITANGTFVFPAIASGTSYAVTVGTQPSSPTQACTITSGTGTVTTAANTNIVVTCTATAFTVGGTITGYTGSGLQLQLNGAGTLTEAMGATSFAFAGTVPSGQTYAVSVLTQPSGPTETCTITNASGTIASATVSNVAVACSPTMFTVGGTVTGLSGNSVVLQDNTSSNKITVSSNGTFSFPAQASGSSYAVSIQTYPASPVEGCIVTSGSGTVTNNNITNVVVVCTTVGFTVGGSISGLSGSGLVLDLNGANATTVAAAATSFTMAGQVTTGATYAVTIATQPSSPTQVCTVTTGTGTMGVANVTSVSIACVTSSFTLSASVSGTFTGSVSIANNGGTPLVFAAPGGTQQFPGVVLSGVTYNVTVTSQPTIGVCGVASGSGAMGGSNLTIVVTCTNLPTGCAEASDSTVWCVGQTVSETGAQLCGYPTGYAGTYYAITPAGAAALGYTIIGYGDCATNYTDSGSEIQGYNGSSCWTTAEEWARYEADTGGYPVVRCTDYE